MGTGKRVVRGEWMGKRREGGVCRFAKAYFAVELRIYAIYMY